eukprot:TRINITY_DN6406_c0_g1_i3.p3 TRINITY_DN6406_c0_g1~~TRINITY_DN6406_c0_g1_i3.p3  ORF type:complete len:122 (+),score=38.02 TRINITY_DN6406_c0_g1_i3:65-430(+)
MCIRDSNYRHSKAAFPFECDLEYISNLTHVSPIISNMYFSMVFTTRITTNGHIQHKIHRKVISVPSPKGDYEACFSSQLIPIVMDSLGKGGYYDSEMPYDCLLYTSPSPRDLSTSRMPSSA